MLDDVTISVLSYFPLLLPRSTNITTDAQREREVSQYHTHSRILTEINLLVLAWSTIFSSTDR